ncbi:MAG: guanylate kinase [Myxococcota bacterium]
MSSDARPAGSRGELFLISAPSGAGKTTLIRGLMARTPPPSELVFSVSHTTRAPRRGELDGREYHFVDAASFRALVEADGFLEWAEVHGNLYGTSKAAVVPYLERGADVIVDLDVQGAAQLMQRWPGVHSVFVLPPTYEELEARLTGRGLDGRAQIVLRLGVALEEIRRYESYDCVIVNDDAKRATDALAAIVFEKRYRRDRMEEAVRRVIADFEAARERLIAT